MKYVLSIILAGLLALPVATPDVAWADSLDKDLCESRARAESGYSGKRLPDIQVGPFTARISGSVAVGVSRSSKPDPNIAAGSGRGAYAREQFEERRVEEFEKAFARCMASR